MDDKVINIDKKANNAPLYNFLTYMQKYDRRALHVRMKDFNVISIPPDKLESLMPFDTSARKPYDLPFKNAFIFTSAFLMCEKPFLNFAGVYIDNDTSQTKEQKAYFLFNQGETRQTYVMPFEKLRHAGTLKMIRPIKSFAAHYHKSFLNNVLHRADELTAGMCLAISKGKLLRMPFGDFPVYTLD